MAGQPDPFEKSPLARQGVSIRIENETAIDLDVSAAFEPPGTIIIRVRELRQGLVIAPGRVTDGRY